MDEHRGPGSQEAVTRAVVGALRSCIHDHGPITAELIASAAKRVVGSLNNLTLPLKRHDTAVVSPST